MADLNSQPAIPAGWELAYTHNLAGYMVQQFQKATGCLAPDHHDAKPRNIGIETLCEADCMVDILVRAYQNKIVLQNVDAIRLSERSNRESTFVPGTDAAISNAIPLLEISDPAIIVDRADVILVWYLPEGVSPPNQMLLWNNVDHLAQSLRAGLARARKGNWRTSEDLFTMTAETKGAINMSPAWFQQARHGGYAVPEISATMKTDDAKEWVASMRDEAAILSGALAIMHPEMYRSGLQVMLNLGQFAEESNDEAMQELLAQWPSVYNVASLMVNRMSPFHVDRFGRPQSFDMLVTFGTYSELYIFLPTLGLTLRYNPGTVIGMSGQMIEHGVGEPNGDRGALAWYMRDDVHEFMHVSRNHFIRHSDIGKL